MKESDRIIHLIQQGAEYLLSAKIWVPSRRRSASPTVRFLDYFSIYGRPGPKPAERFRRNERQVSGPARSRAAIPLP
jgi:hypothetical protein